MSKLDEIRRDLHTIRQHQSESAAEQMADTLVEHIEFLLEELPEAWEKGHDAAEAEEAELKSSPFHVSGCDCGQRRPNPYEADE